MFRQSNNSVAFARQLLDFEPDANQAKLLSTKAQYVMVNCHRQWGKTTMTAMRAVHWAMSKPGQQIAVVHRCGSRWRWRTSAVSLRLSCI